MLIPTDLDGVRAGCGFGIGHARSGGEFIPDGLRGDDDGAFGMRAGGEDSPLIVWLFFYLDMSSGSKIGFFHLCESSFFFVVHEVCICRQHSHVSHRRGEADHVTQ